MKDLFYSDFVTLQLHSHKGLSVTHVTHILFTFLLVISPSLLSVYNQGSKQISWETKPTETWVHDSSFRRMMSKYHLSGLKWEKSHLKKFVSLRITGFLHEQEYYTEIRWHYLHTARLHSTNHVTTDGNWTRTNLQVSQ